VTRTRLSAPAVALALALAAPLAACSSGEESSPPRPDAAATTEALPDATAPPPCVSRMPGQQLTEDEAVVGFDRTNVCPAYVTVAAGTEVTWRNDDTEPFAVEITSAGPGPGMELVVATETIEPGDRWSYEFTDAGAYEFRTDALPDFLGIVEVQPEPAAGPELDPITT
jgi:plastocyanin